VEREISAIHFGRHSTFTCGDRNSGSDMGEVSSVGPSACRPRRVLYVEGNLDATIGGSFFSLLFL